MKLFLSILLLAALPAAFAQNQTPQGPVHTGNVVSNPIQARAETMMTQAENENRIRFEPACPLLLTGASVAPNAHYQPVKAQGSPDSALDLRFRNLSSKAIRSVSITAHVKIKTNVYALDAHPFQVHLTFSDLSRDVDQVSHIALPAQDYLFGVAWVSLDAVTFADGATWSAPQQYNYCRTPPGQGIDRIEAK